MFTIKQVNEASNDLYMLFIYGRMCGYWDTYVTYNNGAWIAKAINPRRKNLEKFVAIYSRRSRWHAVHRLIRIIASTDQDATLPGYVPFERDIDDPASDKLRQKLILNRVMRRNRVGHPL